MLGWICREFGVLASADFQRNEDWLIGSRRAASPTEQFRDMSMRRTTPTTNHWLDLSIGVWCGFVLFTACFKTRNHQAPRNLARQQQAMPATIGRSPITAPHHAATEEASTTAAQHQVFAGGLVRLPSGFGARVLETCPRTARGIVSYRVSVPSLGVATAARLTPSTGIRSCDATIVEMLLSAQWRSCNQTGTPAPCEFVGRLALPTIAHRR